MRDREDVLDRLATLYEESGRAAEAADVRSQIKALLAQPGLTVSRNPSGSAKVSFEFGEDGPSIERLPDIAARAREILEGGNAAVRRKVGRNEPCPCGSGRKFKKCCGR